MKEKALYKMIVVIPSGMKMYLYVFEDRFVLKPNILLLKFFQIAKTFYFTDITNIQLSKASSSPGFFLISGKGPDFRLQFDAKHNDIAENVSTFINEAIH